MSLTYIVMLLSFTSSICHMSILRNVALSNLGVKGIILILEVETNLDEHLIFQGCISEVYTWHLIGEVPINWPENVCVAYVIAQDVPQHTIRGWGWYG